MQVPKWTQQGLVNDGGQIYGAGAPSAKRHDEALFYQPPRRSASQPHLSNNTEPTPVSKFSQRKVGYEHSALSSTWKLSEMESVCSGDSSARQETRRCISPRSGHVMKGNEQFRNPLEHCDDFIVQDAKKPHPTNADKRSSRQVQLLNDKKQLFAFERGSAMTKKSSLSGAIVNSDRVRACMQDGHEDESLTPREDLTPRRAAARAAGRVSTFEDAANTSKRVNISHAGSDAASVTESVSEGGRQIGAYSMRDSGGAPMAAKRVVDSFGIRKGSVCSTEASTPRSSAALQKELWTPRMMADYEEDDASAYSGTPRSSVTGASTPRGQQRAPRPSSDCGWTVASSEYSVPSDTKSGCRQRGQSARSSNATSDRRPSRNVDAQEKLAMLKVFAQRGAPEEAWDELSYASSEASKSAASRRKKPSGKARASSKASVGAPCDRRRSTSSAASYVGSSVGSDVSSKGRSKQSGAQRRRAASASAVTKPSRASQTSRVRSSSISAASTPRLQPRRKGSTSMASSSHASDALAPRRASTPQGGTRGGGTTPRGSGSMPRGATPRGSVTPRGSTSTSRSSQVSQSSYAASGSSWTSSCPKLQVRVPTAGGW